MCANRNHIPASEDFERWSLIFEKFVKVLSPYNTYLVAIYQKFLSAAESIGRTDLTFKYADILLDAYRRYLPIGHPELTQRLRLAYLRKVQGCLRQNCRALLSERCPIGLSTATFHTKDFMCQHIRSIIGIG
ncbi:hypothetical protein ANCCAN_18566, partial [Ancylostoma caninum]